MLLDIFKDCEYPKIEYKKWGEENIKKGRVASILMAGGDGSRLGCKGPKGTVIINGKSLFEIFCNKILRIQDKLKIELSVAIMVSPKNHKATIEFFEKNNYFELKTIEFFIQDELPLLDVKGKKMRERGADGNGSVLERIKTTKLFKRDIKNYTFLAIDNLQANPFDGMLIGFHIKNKYDISLICIDHEYGSMGAIGMENEQIRIIEYMKKRSDNFKFFNTGIYCMSACFLKEQTFELKYHLVKKGDCWKSERFITDVLFYSKKVGVICLPQKKCYNPIKISEDLIQNQKKNSLLFKN